MTAPLPAPLPPFDEHDDHLTVEVLNGITLRSPRPALPHSRVASHLGSILMHRFDGRSGGPPSRPGGFFLMFEPELRLGPDTLVPDLAGWRRERWPLIPRSEAAAARIAPDWVCEILSGSTAKSDRLRKVPLYHRHGVPHLWLVNPLLQTVEVFRHSEPGYIFLATYCDSDLLRAEPFEALDLDLSEIWPEPELLPPPSVPEF